MNHYWERMSAGGTWKIPPGEDLAALRRGLNTPAGEAPSMWPFYTLLNDEGRVDARLRAEHVALSLYGWHQQSESAPMHVAGVGVGSAMRKLRTAERFSEEAVVSRFTRAASATHLESLAYNLRTLISQLKSLNPSQGLDYTLLVRDLTNWQYPARSGRVRRAWGLQFHTAHSTEKK